MVYTSHRTAFISRIQRDGRSQINISSQKNMTLTPSFSYLRYRTQSRTSERKSDRGFLILGEAIKVNQNGVPFTHSFYSLYSFAIIIKAVFLAPQFIASNPFLELRRGMETTHF